MASIRVGEETSTSIDLYYLPTEYPTDAVA